MERPAESPSAVDESISFESPGRFKIVAHASTLLTCDDAYRGLQICLPPAQALSWCIRMETRDGRSVLHRFGGRDILAVPTGLAYELIWRYPTPILSLMLRRDFISRALGADQPEPDGAFTVRDPFISAAGDQLRQTLRLATPPPAMVEALVTAIACRLVAEGQLDRASIGSRTAPVLTDVQRAALEGLVEGALDQALTTGLLATRLGLSRWRFVRRFHSTYAMSPQAFIAERRFARACRLLEESTLSILQIALEVGLSHSHFSRSFLIRFGRSPRDYRAEPARHGPDFPSPALPDALAPRPTAIWTAQQGRARVPA